LLDAGEDEASARYRKMQFGFFFALKFAALFALSRPSAFGEGAATDNNNNNRRSA
jgi:hypothetical protein